MYTHDLCDELANLFSQMLLRFMLIFTRFFGCPFTMSTMLSVILSFNEPNHANHDETNDNHRQRQIVATWTDPQPQDRDYDPRVPKSAGYAQEREHKQEERDAVGELCVIHGARCCRVCAFEIML